MRSVDERSIDEQQLQKLVAAAKAGDQAALHDLIAWAMDYLFPATLSMLHERRQKGTYISETLHSGGADALERLRDDAWAITHTACCRMTVRIDSYRGRNALGRPVQFATWVYAIAHNELRTLLRNRWRERKRYGGSRDEDGIGEIAVSETTRGRIGTATGSRIGPRLPAPAGVRTRSSSRSGSGINAGSAAAPSSSSAGVALDPTHGSLSAVDPASFPEGAVLNQLDQELVREALREAPLTPEQREAVVLFHGYGYPQEQIAAMTGVQVGTVKKRVFDGLRKLRAYVQKRSAS